MVAEAGYFQTEFQSSGGLVKQLICQVCLLFVYPGQRDPVTPAILSLVILSTAALQCYTELKAESSMEALRNLQAAEFVRTIRISEDGQRLDQQLPPTELVSGDIILLEPGRSPRTYLILMLICCGHIDFTMCFFEVRESLRMYGSSTVATARRWTTRL